MKIALHTALYVILLSSIMMTSAFGINVDPKYCERTDDDPPANPPPTKGDEGGDEKDPINAISGATWRTTTDIAIPCQGFDLVLSRTYCSLNAETNAFGPAWTHSLDPRLDVKSIYEAYFSDGKGRVVFLRPSANTLSFGSSASSSAQSLSSVATIGTDWAGNEFEGVAVPSNFESCGRCHGGLLYHPPVAPDIPATYWEKLPAHSGPYQVQTEDLLLESLGEDGWRIVSPGFVYFDFTAQGLAKRFWNAAGQWLEFDRDTSGRLISVRHSSGQAISFEYTGASKLIRRAYVPGTALSVSYSYYADLQTFQAGRQAGLMTAARTSGDTTTTERYSYEGDSRYLTHCQTPSGLTFRYAYTNRMAANEVMSTKVVSGTWAEPGRLYEGTLTYGEPKIMIAGTDAADLSSYVSRRTWTWTSSSTVRDGATFYTTYRMMPKSRLVTEIYYPCGESVTNGYDSATALKNLSVYRGKPYDDAFDIIVSDKYATKTERDEEHRITSVKQAFFRSSGNSLSPLDGAPSVSLTYDEQSRLPAIFTDPCGRVSGADYSAQGLALTNWTELAAGVRLQETFAYTNGLLSEYRDQESRKVTLGYGAGGYATSITPSAGPSLAMGWNASLGILTNLVLQGPGGTSRVIAKEVNELGRVSRVVRTDGLAETFLRDAAGRVTNHVDVAGRVTRTAYHPGGKPSEIIQDANGLAASIRFDYSQQMESLRIRDPLNREVERYVLDGLGRAEKVYDIEGREMIVRYRLGDIVSSVTRFDGTAISFDYDIGARVTRVTYPDGTTTYGWLPCGRPSGATNALATAEYGYDGAGRLVSESVRSRTSSFPDMTLSYALDRSGFATNTIMSIPGVPALLTEKASYDQAARLAAQISEAGTFTNTYCAWSGGLESVSNSSLTASYASDILDRVTNITYRTASGETVRSFAYAYNLSGMITQKVDIAGSSCVTNVYTYDGLNRLLSETTTQSGNETTRQFSYDLAGNRLASVSNGTTNTYSYGIGNRLSAVSDGTGYTHDNAGNVSRIVRNGSTLDLVWNLQGQLLAVTNNGVLAESYTYDPLGRRLSTTTGGATVYHAYNGVQCVADIDASGNLLRSYTWGQGIDNLLAMTVYGASETNTFFAVKDHLGSVQALVNSQGQIVESYRYDAYGSTTILSSDLSHLTSSAIGNRYMFQGREFSTATGLYNFRARWYDSQTGRWLSNDPIGISGGLNLYDFCGNNPMNFRDPNGLFKLGQFVRGAIGVVANTLGAAAGLVFAETGAGAVFAVYCAYGIGANLGNMINAIIDTPVGPVGPASAVVQTTLISVGIYDDSCIYRNIDYGAQILDLGVPLIASGGLDWRLVTQPCGLPGTLAGTLEKVLVDPQTANLAARAVVGANAALSAGEGIDAAVNAGSK